MENRISRIVPRHAFVVGFLLLLPFVARTGDAQSRPLAPDRRSPSNAVLSPDGTRLAFVLGDSLMVAQTDGAGVGRVLSRGLADEASAPVPFIAWSADGRQLLFRRGIGGDRNTPFVVATDGRTPPRALLPDSVAATLVTFQNFYAGGPAWHPDGKRVVFLAVREGDPRHGLQAYVADVTNGKVERWTPEDDRRFNVAWSPDGNWLAITSGDFAPGERNVRGTIELIDARVGADRSLIRVAADSMPLIRNLQWSPNGRYILAQNLARQSLVVEIATDADGAPRATPVAHTLPPRPFASWHPESAALFTTVPEAMSSRVALVSFPDGAVSVLTGPDTSTAVIGARRGPDGSTRLAFSMESGSVPPDVWAARIDTTGAMHDTRNVTRTGRWLADTARPVTRIVRWTSGEGDSLSAQLLLPRQRSPGALAPLVIMPYGGYSNTFAQLDYFLNEAVLPLLARGYAVVRPNTRGQAMDARDQGKYGEPQLEDTLRLIDALEASGLINATRVALLGHSHGASMVYFYLSHADRFCAGVAVNGRADWVLQGNHPSGSDGLLPGLLGGKPSELPGLYRRLSPAANAGAVRVPLLAVAGGKDTQILPANVPIMADSMSAYGRTIETLVFPDEGHLINDPENRARLLARTLATIERGCAVRVRQPQPPD